MELFDPGLLVPISMFFCFALVVCVLLYFRHKNRADMQATVRFAMEQGQPLSPELLERLGQPVYNADTDLRRGGVAIALALGFVGLAFGIGEEEAVGPMIGIASFPLLIGLAYIGFWYFNRRQG